MSASAPDRTQVDLVELLSRLAMTRQPGLGRAEARALAETALLAERRRGGAPLDMAAAARDVLRRAQAYVAETRGEEDARGGAGRSARPAAAALALRARLQPGRRGARARSEPARNAHAARGRRGAARAGVAGRPRDRW